MCAVSWTMMWPKASVVSSTETPLARYSVRFMFVSSDCVSQILVRRAQSFSSGGFGRHDAVEQPRHRLLRDAESTTTTNQQSQTCRFSLRFQEDSPAKRGGSR